MNRKALIVVQLAVVCAWVVHSAATASGQAINVPTFHLDGAFQTASMLYRVDAGQVPGRDFYPYLGVGPLLLLLPLFKAAGSHLTASVFSASLLTQLSLVLLLSVLWRLMSRQATRLSSLAAGTLLTYAGVVLPLHVGLRVPGWLSVCLWPGNSLRPLRAAIVYAAMALFLLIHRRVTTPTRRFAAYGLLAGVTMLWSNDYAIVTAGTLGLLVLLELRREQSGRIKLALLYGTTWLGAWLLLLTLSTAGHPLQQLAYNFRDVAPDQWWYFAPYREVSRIFHWYELPLYIVKEVPFALVALTVVLAIARETRRIEHLLLGAVGFALMAGASVATYGGHKDAYFFAFRMWGFVTAIIAGVRVVAWLIGRPLERRPRLVPVGTALAALASVVIVHQAVRTARAVSLARAEAPRDAARFAVPELGGYLPTTWREYIELARRTPTRAVVEEYWGIWSALHRIISPWPVDSVIHALGRQREVARAMLPAAEVIITTRPRMSPQWQPWNVSENYWFYEELIYRRQQVAQSPNTMVFMRGGTPPVDPPVDCRIDAAAGAVMVTPQRAGFVEITLDYAYDGPRRSLLMAANNYVRTAGLEPAGYLSLDPRATRAQYPAYLPDVRPYTLPVFSVPSDSPQPVLRGCTARELSGPMLWAPHFTIDPTYVTDSNWSHGIARRRAGFFITHSTETEAAFGVGRQVELPDGTRRNIIHTQRFQRFLNVFLDGPQLDPVAVGLPTRIKPVAPDEQQRSEAAARRADDEPEEPPGDATIDGTTTPVAEQR